MQFAILHLSDIHFKGTDTTLYEPRIKLIANAVKGKTHAIDFCVCIITGDIVDCGRSVGYSAVEGLIRELKNELEASFQRGFKVLVIPGNHDCAFEEQKLRERVMLTLQKPIDNVDKETIRLLTSVQSNFFAFTNKVSDFGDGPWAIESLSHLVEYELENTVIQLLLLNSSWISSKEETPGVMFIPTKNLELFSDVVSHKQKDTFRIVASHHPFNWMHPTNTRQLKLSIQERTDITLYGHEHIGDAEMVQDKHGEKGGHFHGGKLFGSSAEESAFNLMLIRNKNVELYEYCFKNEFYQPKESEAIQFSLTEKKKVLSFTADFERYLQDPGTSFTHRRVDKLKLTDIFVCPSVEVVSDTSETGRKQLDDIGEVEKYIIDNSKTVITGIERSGKTSLAKILCKSFYEKGYCPLYIKARNIFARRVNHLDDVLKELIREVYEGTDSVERYFQESSERGVALIDGLKDLNVDQKINMKDILNKLPSYFKSIVCFMTEEEYLEYLTGEKIEEELLKYNRLQILPFSRLKRHHLAQKWATLGLDEGERSKISRYLNQIEKRIDVSLGKDLIPKYPLFLLTILQTLEAVIPHATPTHGTCGSFGYVYEALITARLAFSSGSLDDIGSLYNYLSELAYFMYSQSTPKLSVSSYDKWHGEYRKKYVVRLEISKIKKQLIKADIFDGFSDDIKFKYKYIYCYFVANYLHQNIAKNEIRQHITQIAKSLHNEQAANIVMFLCHLSKDAIIINSILESASNIFQNFPECDLKEDVGFLRLTSEDMPFSDLPKAEDKDKSRHKVLKEQDDIESRQGKQNYTDYPTIKSASQDSSDIEASQVNASFKTIQILGQILTNFQGKMIGEEKEVIAKTCFSLSLRVISSFLKYITSDQKEIIQLFEEKIHAEHPELAPSEIKIKSQKTLFQLSEFMVLAIIKHTSDSVGLLALSDLFDIIFQSESSTPYKLLSLSIKLDYYGNFPIEDLRSNIRSERSNYFTKTLIQHLVWLHLYLYEVDYATRQKVGELIEIDGTQKILIKTKQKLLTGKSSTIKSKTKKSKNRRKDKKKRRGKRKR